MKQFFFFLFVFCSILSFGQDGRHDHWNKTIKYYPNEGDEAYAAVVILDHRIQEFKREYDKIGVISSKHIAIKILEDKAIEEYNKVYIPLNSQLISLKARTVKPDGTIIYIDKDNIKLLDQEQGMMMAFAIKGIETGDILEYIVKQEQAVDFCGMEIFQRDIPVQKAIFDVYNYNRFDVTAKVYNGLSELEPLISGRGVTSVTENIPALPFEDFSARNEYRMRAAYNVESIVNSSGVRHDIVTWEQIVKEYAWFGEVNKVKGVKPFFKSLGITNELSELEKVLRLEKYFKEEFTLKNRSASSDQFKNILKNKYGNEVDLTRLMKYLLSLLDVKSVWLVSTDRLDMRIDPQFANFHSLSEHVLFIPSLGNFLAMGYFNMRFGPPPACVLNNYALIVDEDENTNPIGQIQYNVFQFTELREESIIDINPNFSDVNIKKKGKYTGYFALEMRDILNWTDETEFKDIMRESEADYLGDVNLTNVSVKNESFDLSVNKKPLEIEMEIIAKDLIEDGGDVFILNIGKLIGEHIELYNEEKRHTPIEIEYPYQYIGKIKINVPEGFSVSGLEELKKDIYLKLDEDQKLAGFQSIVKLKDGVVSITIFEFYHGIYYNKSDYSTFRNVTNTGADFNKAALIFEKK